MQWLELWRTYFTLVRYLELWSRACQGPRWMKAQGLFCVGFWRMGVRRGCGEALEMSIPVGCPGLRLLVPRGCELFPLPAHSPAPALLQGPQAWNRACLFSHSLSLTGLWVPDSRLEVPLPGVEGPKIPVPFWASLCLSLCCATAMLGAARRTEKHKYH